MEGVAEMLLWKHAVLQHLHPECVVVEIGRADGLEVTIAPVNA
jgi:hypothetical protein